MTLAKFDNPNRHEMVIFEEKPNIEMINEWATSQLQCNRKIFIFDTKSQKTIENQKRGDIELNKKALDQYLQSYSLDKRIENIQSILRQNIWSAIKEKHCGVSFFFNFQSIDKDQKNRVKEIEHLLDGIFKKFYGFPLFCSCLHDATINIIDLLQLMKFHTDLQVFKHNNKKELEWNVTNESPSSDLRSIARRFHESAENESSESYLEQTAQVSFSEENDPFYLREKTGEVIGVASNLPSLLYQLESAPLDTFCFHCYRISGVDLEGNSIMPVPRSDIPLWIEYSIGDSYLARKIYNAIKKTIGYYDAPELATNFAKKTTRDSVLNIIRERTNQLAKY